MAGNRAHFNDLMNKGHSAAWDLEWEKASAYYRQALDEFPEDTTALSYLASALFELARYDEALSYYEKASSTTPEDPLPVEKIAQILETQGSYEAAAETALRAAELHFVRKDVEKAVENWTRSITLNPKNIRSRTRLALTYERTHRKPQAVTQYLAIASLMQHAGNVNRAVELVNHALKLVPESNEAKQALGLLRANQLLPRPSPRSARPTPPVRKPSETPQLEAPRQELSDKPIDPVSAAGQKALSALAELMFEQPDEEESNGRRSLSSIAMGTGPLSAARVERRQIVLHLSQAVDFQARKRIPDAAEQLENAVKSGLNHPAAYFDLGLLRFQLSTWDDAIRQLQHAVGHPDYALAARLLLGQSFRKIGRGKDAAVHFLEALKLADSAVIEKEYAPSLRQAYEPIIEAFMHDTAKQAHDKLSSAIEGLLVRPDWRDQMLRARRQLPAPQPGIPPAPLAELLTQAQSSQVLELMTNIQQMARNGMYRLAMEEAYRALHFAPTFLPLHTFMGDILLQQDHIPEAITKFSVVARAYSIRGESHRAIDILRRITRLSPLDLTTRRRLIEQLTAAGQIEATIQEYLDLGDVYYRLAELDKARDTYEKALKVAQQSNLNNWTAEILHHTADIDLQRLDWRRALRQFKQIQSINPEDVKAAMQIVDLNYRLGQETDALAALGNFVDFMNRRRKQQEVVKLLEDLMQVDPGRVAIQRTLAGQYQLV
ncbi:MAG TPA: tetratricopeptide repeat protein, partial [Anaerolineales bacterium]|nr:tetratricopeptide repeat protein [Anaerolineales bacterium]